jgi:hypothetical protein
MRSLWIGAAVAAGGAAAHPLTGVVTILRDMADQLHEDGKADEKMNKKITCKNDKDIADSKAVIKTEEANIKNEKATIAEMIALSDELTTKKTIREKEHDKLTFERTEAKAAREKQNAEFVKNEADTESTLTALDQALTLLGKNTYKGADQGDKKEFLQVANTILQRAGANKKAVALKKLVEKFSASTSFLQGPNKNYQGYAAQSSQIFGMLQEMKIQFTQELKDLRKAEKNAFAAWTKYDTETEKLINLAKTEIEKLKGQIAEAKAKHAAATTALALAEKTLEDEIATLAVLEKKAADDKEHYAARVKSRGEEIAAINDTIAILDDPATFENMGKTQTSFLQLSSVQPTLERVAQILDAASGKRADIKLVQMYAKVGAFDKILNAIAGVVQKINREARADKKALEECKENKKTLTSELKKNTATQKELAAKITALNNAITKLEGEIETLKADHESANAAIKQGASDRAKANDEFQTALVDQRTTIDTLSRAIDRMKQKYSADASGSFIQAASTQEPAFDAKGDSNNPQGAQVITLLTGIHTKAVAAEKTLIMTERQAQRDYEVAVQAANTNIIDLEKQMTLKKKTLADTSDELLTTEKAKEAADESVKQSQKALDDEVENCAFITDKFDFREGERKTELDNLQKAVDTIKALKPAP